MHDEDQSNIPTRRLSKRKVDAENFLSSISLTPLSENSVKDKQIVVDSENIELNILEEESDMKTTEISDVNNEKKDRPSKVGSLSRARKSEAQSFLSSIGMSSPATQKLSIRGKMNSTVASSEKDPSQVPHTGLNIRENQEYALDKSKFIKDYSAKENAIFSHGYPDYRYRGNSEFSSFNQNYNKGQKIYFAKISDFLSYGNPNAQISNEAGTRFRIYFSTTSYGHPFFTTSTLRYYDKKKKKANAHKVNSSFKTSNAGINSTTSLVLNPELATVASESNPNTETIRVQNESYGVLLFADKMEYNPRILDDPDLKTGKHKNVITLPSYMVSILQYTKPSELRAELNERFRLKHPELDSTMTLSKIRNIKTDLLQIGISEDLEMSTVAKAYAYFEKLTLKNYVNKENRKKIGAICLILASKINDRKDTKNSQLFSTIEKQLDIPASSVREHEFSIFAQLGFDLHIPDEEYLPHLDRIINTLGYNNIQEYLGGKPIPLTRPLSYL